MSDENSSPHQTSKGGEPGDTTTGEHISQQFLDSVGTPVEPSVISGTDREGQQKDLVGNYPHVSDPPENQSWRALFPFDPYLQQIDGIERLAEVLSENGFAALEGQCGTGKTLMAVVATLYAIRANGEVLEKTGEVPQMDTALVVTPLKQQLRQFIDDMRAVNKHLELGNISLEETLSEEALELVNDAVIETQPVNTVVLRGKTDVLPYAQVGTGPFAKDSNISVQDASENTAEVTENILATGSSFPIPGYDSNSEKGNTLNEKDGNNSTIDPDRGEALLDAIADQPGERLILEGVESRFPREMVHSRDLIKTAIEDPETDFPQTDTKTGIAVGNEESDSDKDNHQETSSEDSIRVPPRFDGYIDPFLVGYVLGESISFDAAPDNVLDREMLMKAGLRTGVCPYRSMVDNITSATVIVGNYYHAFDPDTRQMIFGGETGLNPERVALIVDEAHMIEERLRDALSDTVGPMQLRRAENDLEIIKEVINKQFTVQSNTPQRDLETAIGLVRSAFDVDTTGKNQNGKVVGLNDVERQLDETSEFVHWLRRKLIKFTALHLREQLGDNWDEDRRGISRKELQRRYYDAEYPLQDITEPDDDKLAQEFRNDDEMGKESWKQAEEVLSKVDVILREGEAFNRTPTAGSVRQLLYRWRESPYDDYFRLVEVEFSPKSKGLTEMPDWYRTFTPRYELFNTVPARELGAMLSQFAGGVLMSATLSPLDIFCEGAGLNDVERGIEMDATASGIPQIHSPARTVEKIQYPLEYPEDNRLSLTVKAPKFTSKARGQQTTDWDEMTETRQIYASIITDIATTKGNILLCLPNYGEAHWAEKVLDTAGVEKAVLRDKSSSAMETSELLEEFFSGDEPQILVTSSLGTITVGVDYSGERLHTVAVIGVPYPYISLRKEAVKKGYDRRLKQRDTDYDGFDVAMKTPTIRKARQAIGRVIRSPDDVGVRLLVDERYSRESRRYSRQLSIPDILSEQERAEFRTISPELLQDGLERFWTRIQMQTD